MYNLIPYFPHFLGTLRSCRLCEENTSLHFNNKFNKIYLEIISAYDSYNILCKTLSVWAIPWCVFNPEAQNTRYLRILLWEYFRLPKMTHLHEFRQICQYHGIFLKVEHIGKVLIPLGLKSPDPRVKHLLV